MSPGRDVSFVVSFSRETPLCVFASSLSLRTLDSTFTTRLHSPKTNKQFFVLRQHVMNLHEGIRESSITLRGVLSPRRAPPEEDKKGRVVRSAVPSRGDPGSTRPARAPFSSGRRALSTRPLHHA